MGTMSEVESCYAVPNISARGYQCKTNLAPSTVMRGAGRPEGVLIAEHWIRAVADFLHVSTASVSAITALVSFRVPPHTLSVHVTYVRSTVLKLC